MATRVVGRPSRLHTTSSDMSVVPSILDVGTVVAALFATSWQLR